MNALTTEPLAELAVTAAMAALAEWDHSEAEAGAAREDGEPAYTSETTAD